MSLFAPEGEWLSEPGLRLFWHPHFFTQALADQYLQTLQQLDWQQGQITLYGKTYQEPRLSLYCGDKGAHYSYSQKSMQPRSWHPLLLSLKNQLSQHFNVPFNAVLCNHYRNGQDGMGWHSDDEPELGPSPTIASLSFGATRRFILRSKLDHNQKRSFNLNHGSLLLMAGDTQQHWQHAVPKTQTAIASRINLTFRAINPS